VHDRFGERACETADRKTGMARMTYSTVHSGDAWLCVPLRSPGLGESPCVGVALSNTLMTDFCIKAVQKALVSYGIPNIFNTFQGY
jgi:hypothetical protein